MVAGQQIIAPEDRNAAAVSVGTGAIVNVLGGNTTTLANYATAAGRRARVSIDVDAFVTATLAAGEGAQIDLLLGAVGAAVETQRQFPAASADGTERSWHADAFELGPSQEVIVRLIVGAGAGQVSGWATITGVEYDA